MRIWLATGRKEKHEQVPFIKKGTGLCVSFWTDPHPTDRERKALLKNKTVLSGLAPNFKRGKAVYERNTLKNIEMDVLGDKLFHLGARGEAGAVQAFRFQGAKEFFHRRIVVGTSGPGH